MKGRGKRVPTLLDWRVRWRTVMVWSCAVTSLRFFGRLGSVSRMLKTWMILERTDYFSTHGWRLVFSLTWTLGAEAPFKAASLRALRSKKLAMMSMEILFVAW